MQLRAQQGMLPQQGNGPGWELSGGECVCVCVCVCARARTSVCVPALCAFGEVGGRYGEGEEDDKTEEQKQSKDDQRSHGNKERWSKQFQMGPMTMVKDVY